MNPTFSSPPQKVFFKGLLFDMDGTLIDSTSAVEKHWHSIGEELGVDPNIILLNSHGRRSVDILKLISPEKANWESRQFPGGTASLGALGLTISAIDIKHMESLLPLRYGADTVEIPGARDLLNAVTKADVPWGIVTSGTTPLVMGWLEVLKLPVPKNLVVAEDVENGKPDPSCYLMGKEKLGLEAGAEVLVLEDSPAGIKAGRDALCKVCGVVTSHTLQEILAARPDYIVKDLSSLKILNSSEIGVELEISDALVSK